MTIDSTSGLIEWTPTNLQQNKIFTVTVNAYDGINNNTYDFTVRTYDNT
jgi:hypothetical protein